MRRQHEIRNGFPPGSLILYADDLHFVIGWYIDIQGRSRSITLSNEIIGNMGWWRFDLCKPIVIPS